MNKLVKRCNNAIEDEDRMAGRVPNWVKNLPRINQAINSMGGKDSNNTSSYEVLFGMQYHDRVSGSMQEVRNCKTIEERLAMFPDPSLQHVAENLCILRDPEDGDIEAQISTYWEDSDSDEDNGVFEKSRKQSLQLCPSRPHL